MAYQPHPERVAEASFAQQKAYDAGQNVWVSANAGTGKTTVLTQRLLALLLADETLEPREILALTFTRVAAGEMAERLPKLIAKWADKTPEQLAHEVPQVLGIPFTQSMPARLEMLAERVRLQPPTLTTIHGFAQQVLTALPAVAGLPEGFGLLDDSAQKRMLKQVQDALLIAPPEGIHLYLATLLDNMGEKALHELPQMLTSNWWRIEEMLGDYGLAEGVARVLAQLDEALALPPKEEAYRTRMPSVTQYDALRTLGQAVPKTEAEWASILLTSTAKTARKNIFKKEQQTLIASDVYETFVHAAADLEAALKARRAWRGREMTEAVLVWAAHVQERYRQAKVARGVLDFNDLLRALERVLANPESNSEAEHDAAAWLWHRLDTRYRHLVVDEAQDNNASQSRIVHALAKNLLAGEVGGAARTVLAVGDVKQSIYRFQGAQPQWFLQLRALLEDWSPHTRTLQMAYTFRNSPTILEVVNATFATLELANAVQGEVTAWPTHQSVYAERPARVELWPLEEPQAGDAPSDDNDFVREDEEDETEALDDETENTSPRWLLAEERATQVKPSAKLRSLQRVAKWLKAQHDAGVKLPSTDKPLRYSDVLVVVQRNETAQLLGALLKREGVAVAAGMGQTPPEVADIVALLRVAYNQADHLALAQVLKGLCGFTDADLLALNTHANGGPWFAALPEAERGLKAFLAQLPTPCPPAALIQRAAVWWGLALPPFATLLAWAEVAEAVPIPHLGALGTLVARLETEDLPPAALPEETEGGVRILTVHRAKGLEAPLVILPETTRPMAKSQEKLLWGEGLVLYKSKKGISDLEDSLHEIEAAQCRADALRGLYVGLTRATDWLVISGWKTGKASQNPSSDL